MDMIQELYNICSDSLDAEKALLEINKELLEYIESNISDNEKVVFLYTLESIIINREKYFFKAGFQTAKNLILN